MKFLKNLINIFLLFLLFLPVSSYSQKHKKKKLANSPLSFEIPKSIQWRSIGPYRGGRASSVSGVINQPNVFYFGSTGGGVWKTENGGQSWKNISDGYFGGSIGAVAVSESDTNIIYVGTGEETVRGNVSPGYGGFWKSYDAGKTWKKLNLNIDQVQIGRIRIDPKNSNIVFIAVIGDLFKNSKERGIYKSIDGGKSWKKVLYVNEKSGGNDVVFEPGNSRVLYASTWNIRRTPYSLESGGLGSYLWKSTDGGESWKNISSHAGLPNGIWGKIGIAVSTVNPSLVYALIENENGGLYKSLDGGTTWKLINDDRSLRQRAWYYTRIYADTEVLDRVYIMNVRFWRSEDGGKTFKNYNTPHGDHHDLWIAPEDNNRLVVADDGGAQVSYDGANNWSTYMNQPTAQYYRITTDNSFPYNLLVAQQDNSTQRVPHRVNSGSISERNWESSAGGESAHLAADPINPNIVYGGSYGGYLTRLNHETGESRSINVWPNNPMGHGAENMKYRFQWNFPIFFSPHNPKKLYTTSNHFHVTTNEGQSWDVISPDLTRNEAEKLGPSGGPITKDNTAVEYYATIFAACESPYEKDLLWSASDDGMIHLSKNGGENWEDVSPPIAPKHIMWNSVEPDPFIKGGLYVAGTLYKTGDYRPYLYKTKNYGKNWEKIVGGIPNNHFTRVLRADPKRKGLLYAGTESGVHISFDDGISWRSFQINLPLVPITDLTIKYNNLIAATQGRSIWMIDDLTPLHQINNEIMESDFHIFKPIDSYRMGYSGWGGSSIGGQNHHNGVEIFFNIDSVKTGGDSLKVSLEFLDLNKNSIKKFTNHSKANKLKVRNGSNSFIWNMRHENAEGFDGLIMWAAGLTGPKAVPGNYSAKLNVNGKTKETEFTILKDERSNSSIDDLQAQFDFLIEIRDKVTEIHKAIKEMRSIKSQLITFKSKIKDNEELVDKVKSLVDKIKIIENELYQTKNKSRQDPLNYPIRLNNKLAHLTSVASNGNYKPTDQMIEVKNELIERINKKLNSWNSIKNKNLKNLNNEIRNSDIDLISIN